MTTANSQDKRREIHPLAALDSRTLRGVVGRAKTLWKLLFFSGLCWWQSLAFLGFAFCTPFSASVLPECLHLFPYDLLLRLEVIGSRAQSNSVKCFLSNNCPSFWLGMLRMWGWGWFKRSACKNVVVAIRVEATFYLWMWWRVPCFYLRWEWRIAQLDAEAPQSPRPKCAISTGRWHGEWDPPTLLLSLVEPWAAVLFAPTQEFHRIIRHL